MTDGTAKGTDAAGAFASLPIGASLRQYRILSILGHGGFGITYLAEHTSLKKHVAIKEYFPQQFAVREGTRVHPSSAGARTFRWGLDRFVKEAEDLARFRHRGIVDVTDHFEDNDTAYMVLAYEGGQNFGGWLRHLGRNPTQAEIDRILGPLLDAVAFVHEKGLLHRDIAPDNILIREDGSPVLIDFGAARVALNDHTQTSEQQPLAGASGRRAMTAIVKDGYSPPEQYNSEGTKQGPWGDIYSIGTLLYLSVTGQPPIPAPLRREAPGAMSAVRDAKSDVASGGYRRHFLEAIDWALKLEPAERPQSIEAWRGRLNATSFSELPHQTGADVIVATNIGMLAVGLRRPIVVAGVALAALLAGFMMVKAWRPEPQTVIPTAQSTPQRPAGGIPAKTPDAPSGSVAGKAALVTPTAPASTPAADGSPPRAVTTIGIELPKTVYKIGDTFSFAVTATIDCHFLVYTVSADDKVEVHDPNISGAFMGDPVLKAGQRRAIPIAGAPGQAIVNPPGGTYEIGAVCGRDELSRLGLSAAQLTVPAKGGKRSFSFAVESAVARIKRDEISHTTAAYTVTP